MAVLETVKAFYRGPTPPYPKLAGPINLTSQQRTFELSEPQRGSIEVSIEDIEPEWIRVGNCWSIESELGEDLWAGFSEEEEWEMDADSITIPLLGPLLGLLSIEINQAIPSRGAAGFTISKLIEAAQATAAQGLTVGSVENGVLVDLTFGGETVADAIQILRDQTNFYFREQAVELMDGSGIEFKIDFGILRNPTSIILTRNEIVAGVFIRGRYPVTLSLLGPSSTFDGRAVSTVQGDSSSSIPTRSTQPLPGVVFREKGVSPTDGFPLVNPVQLSNIGPAATTHASVIEDRFAGDLAGSAEQRYFDLLKGINEILITLDSTIPKGRQPKLGDLVGVEVSRWARSFSVFVVDAHVHAIEPHEEDGSRDLVLALHPLG